MNSTGSGKSSTVSSVSELLDLYEEDPEEILFNLGFGREEPDLASRVPCRFINNSSSARGIDVKVYLGAQLQRMELESPNYALTSRFRQIEVLTSVANEFFQLYSQVSGQPVQRIIPREQGGEVEEEGVKEFTPVRRTSSVLNVAKLLKKTISKHNLHAAASELPEAHMLNQHTQLNGHGPSEHTSTNGHALSSPEHDSFSTDPDHKAETVNQKHNRKKDSCSLATVTEETSGDGEADDSPEENGTGTAANGEHQPDSADSPSDNQRKCEGTEAVKEEEEDKEEDKNITSTPEKAPPIPVPLQLAQLRNENADSFDMEEIQSNEDDAVSHRTSRATDLSRTVSQQSDSSGFAEEPSADSNSYLKVQESIDSCDSETTVTSHPSLDVSTPIAVDKPVFDLPDDTEEEMRLLAEPPEKSRSQEEDEHDKTSEEIPQYKAHQFPWDGPMEMQQDDTVDQDRVDSREHDDAEPESEITPSMSAPKQEPQPELEHTENLSALEQNSQCIQNQTDTTADTEPSAEAAGFEDQAQEQHEWLDSLSSPVCRALKRAKQLDRPGQLVNPQSDDATRILQRGRGRGRESFTLQRSSSLPSSFLSPSRVVSSVRIQFGQGQVSCTQPRYSFKYTQESGGEEEEEKEEQSNCLSTLMINPASSSDSHKQPRLPSEASVPPKPIPRYQRQSTGSLRSASPLPDSLPGGHAHFGSTQSVPDLSSSIPQTSHFQHISDHQNQQNWNPGQMAFPYPNPNVQYLNPSPNPSPSFNPSQNPFSMYPPPQYPSPFQSYASLPNLLNPYNPSFIHHCSLTSLHQPTTPTAPQHGSLHSLHQPSTFTTPHSVSHGSLRAGNPVMHHQNFHHQLPYHATPCSPCLDFHGYNINPNLAFPQPVTQYPPLSPEHSLHPGHVPPPPGFFPYLDSTFGSGHSIYQGRTHPALNSTEMQLRKVLHDIRGTVQSLSQNQADILDGFKERTAPLPNAQSLTELQQKRHCLNLFRSQMMDLELSITRQQALVYKHLSPADRMEVEQLQSLRSSVREELQELEQQLEDRLMELTHQVQFRGLHRGSSIDSLSTAAALRAMEPVSDLLREQLLLQSEISYGSHSLSTNASSRSISPVQRGGEACEQKQGIYRASINITPVPPPRSKTQTEEEDEQRERAGEVGGGEKPQMEGAAGGVGLGDLQDLLRQMRASVVQEVRREIYSELMATVSPRQTPVTSGQHSL